ncbi:MAG: 2,3-bisphosphoglycerate-dependent phosphoglycerate mutase [Bacteriovoracaceae bacterium]|nr:2,3-bisphosphoglycerate-dependent phosphoglycerate mutase [Bacteriovoracaceae bacterium]
MSQSTHIGSLLLLRHGQSAWNKENRFTGWIDVDLAPAGIEEAEKAGDAISKLNLKWDMAHTSRLKRAQKTLDIVLKKLKQNPPIWIDSALNERFYGDLQGLDKDETRKKFGDEQVHIWRRSFDVPPPGGESLQDTSKRTLPYFKNYILPEIKSGKNILVVAHGNSLRSIIMDVEKLSPEEILKRELATGVPLVYQIDANGKVLKSENLS